MNLIKYFPAEAEGKPDWCPACGAIRQNQSYDKIPSLFRCPGCGLLSRSPREIALIREANIEAFDGMRQGWWEIKYDEWNALERGKILPPHAVGKALEIGPGRGGFIAYLQRNGYKVEGIDISSAICSDLEKRFGVTMVCGTLEEFCKTLKYDLISAHHVMEHLWELSDFLVKCRSLLSEEGFLLLSCPNASSWLAEFRAWPGYEPYHSFFFTPDTLSKVLSRNGFTVERVCLRQPFTGWWNVLIRKLVGEVRVSPSRKSTTKIGERFIRFLFNVVRFVGSVFLLPLSIVTSLLLHGEEIVILAVKTRAADSLNPAR